MIHELCSIISSLCVFLKCTELRYMPIFCSIGTDGVIDYSGQVDKYAVQTLGSAAGLKKYGMPNLSTDSGIIMLKPLESRFSFLYFFRFSYLYR